MKDWDSVILVDENDVEIGIKDKLQAHIDGDLHRAFSIFIFNSKNELLLQKRALTKYHSPGLWTNTCCSHPQPGLSLEESLSQRLMIEMGMACELSHWGQITYKASFENGLTEYEYDHIYKGVSDQLPQPNADEVAEYKYITIKDLQSDIEQKPEEYTAWLKLILNKL